MMLSDGTLSVPALDGCSAVAVGDSLVVYGGKRGPFSLSSELFALDLATTQWHRLLTSGEAPIGRAYHSCCRFGSSLIIFGGLTAIGLDDVHYNRYNVFANVDALPPNDREKFGEARFRDSGALRRVTQQRQEQHSLFRLDLGGYPSWSTMVSYGVIPVTRAHHSACVWKNQMFVTGGYSCLTTGRPTDEEAISLSDVHALDLQTMTWSRIMCQPGPRSVWGAASANLGEYWVIQGGVQWDGEGPTPSETDATWIFHMQRGEWRRLNAEGTQQAAMHSAVRVGTKVLFFGGCARVASQFFDEVRSLDLFDGTFRNEDFSSQQDERPVPLCRSAAAVVGNEVWLIGGIDAAMQRSTMVYAYEVTSGKWREVSTRPSLEVKYSVTGLAGGAAYQGPVGGVIGAAGYGGATVSSSSHSTTKKLMVTSAIQTRGQYDDGFAADGRVPDLIVRSRQDLETSMHTAAAGASSTLLSFGTLNPLEEFDRNMRTEGLPDTNFSFVAQEIQARMNRMKDLQMMPADPGRVHQHWKEELEKLRVEHTSWKDRISHETSELQSQSRRFLDVLPLPRPNAERATIEQVRLKRPVANRGFVSPSIAKLGLQSELQQSREHN